MKKNVWIINHYAGNTFFEKGGRHYWFAKYLKKKGYEPVVFFLNAKKWFRENGRWLEKQAEEIDVPFVFVNAKLYDGNGKDRIINMLAFYKNVQLSAKEYAELHGKPDIIYASSVHPLSLVAGIKLAKFYGVKCISEVRDLWPESIFAYSNRIRKRSLLAKLLYRGERWIYKKSDALIFTMAGGADYIKEHQWDTEQGGPIDLKKVFHINNGIDLEVFDYNRTHFQMSDKDLSDEESFNVIYVGSIRKVNNISRLLDIAKRINNKTVRFLIWGDGDEKEVLLERVKSEGIRNVVFKGKVDKKYIPSIVSKADLNLMHGSDNPILRYGLSANKLFDYFAAGKPILVDFSCKYNPADEYHVGIKPVSYDEKGITDVIEAFAKMDAETLTVMGENARKAAAAYDFSTLTNQLISVIEEALREGTRIMTKVCHVTSAHNAGDIRIFHKECLSLAEAGYDVYLVERGNSCEKEGIHVVGLGDVPHSRIKRMLKGARTAYKTALSLDCEIYHLHDPELLPYALKLKRKGKKVVFDSHELTREQIRVKPYLPAFVAGVLAKAYSIYENRILKRIDAVVFPCPVNGSFPLPGKKQVYLNNLPRLSELYDKYDPTYRKDSDSICTIGSLTYGRGVKHAILAAAKANCKLYLGGNFSPAGFEQEIRSMPESKNAVFLGYLNRDQVTDVYKRSQICVSALLNVGQYYGVENLSTKVYEGMAMGLPVIMSRNPYNERMIEQYQFGVCVDPENIDEFAGAIRDLLDHPEKARQMGENGRKAIKEQLNWELEQENLVELYKEILYQ